MGDTWGICNTIQNILALLKGNPTNQFWVKGQSLCLVASRVLSENGVTYVQDCVGATGEV